MNVADYRELINKVSDTKASLVSAVTGHEQRGWAIRLQDAVDELKRTPCPFALERDLDAADKVIRLSELLLADKKKEFDRADSAFIRMAYNGGGW